MEKIFLTTQDNVKIAADLYDIEKPISWLVLLHMLPATKKSWENFANEARKKGYGSIAIDLRGHGESEGGPEGFFYFKNEEHQNSILDVQSTIDYLIKNKKAASDKIIFIGASIGANLSLQYISENTMFKAAILLSPGLNYRGIKTEPMIKKLQNEQNVFFISARDDGANAEENQKLYNLAPVINKKIQIYETGGHGTDILKNQPNLVNLIFKFLE